MSAEEEDAKPQPYEDAAVPVWTSQDEERGACGQDEPYDNFKIISKRALADYERAQELFLDFLATADVWSSEEVSSTIIDFHLVEKCRTKFRAFVRSHGAKVKFDPVDSAPRKQEYHGTVTVTRACKQQFLTKNPEVVRPGEVVVLPSECEAPKKDNKPMLQCAAPTPITTGGRHIPYTPDDIFDHPGTFGRLPPALREYLSPQYGFPMHPSPRDTTTGAPPMRHVKQEPVAALQPGEDTDLFQMALARNAHGAGPSSIEAGQDLKAWMDPLAHPHSHTGAMDMSECHLERSSTFPSQRAAFPSQGLSRKRFSLQDGYTGLTAARGPTGGALLPDASTLLGRRHDTSLSACGDSLPLEAQRRASCGLLNTVHIDGLPSQSWLAHRRTSAPNNARRSDGYTGMPADLALAAQRFLNSSSKYPEGAGVDQYDWLDPHMSAPPPVAVGMHHNRLTDASSRKSPRISYDTATMQLRRHGSAASDASASGVQPPLAWQSQQPLQSAAQMMLQEPLVKSEDMHVPYANMLSVTPLSAPLPLYDNSASAPLPLTHLSHASAPLPGLPNPPPPVHTHSAALMDGQQPSTDKDMEGLWQLLAPEAAPQEHQLNLMCNLHAGGTPNMTSHQSPSGASAMQPAGPQSHRLHLATSPHGCTTTPPANPQHPAAAGHAQMHRPGRGIGESYAAIDGLCSASFSIRSESSAAVSLSDMQPMSTPRDSWTNANTGPSVPGPGAADATVVYEGGSECGYGPPNPTGHGPPPNPESPLPLLLNRRVLDGWSGGMAMDCIAPLKHSLSTRDMFADIPGGMRRRRQSSNATMQAPTVELHDESDMQRLVVRASDTSGASTDMPACGFPMEPDAWANEGFLLPGPLYKVRRTSM